MGYGMPGSASKPKISSKISLNLYSTPKNYRKLTAKQRFIEAARNVEADETGETFERAIKTIIRSKTNSAK